MQFGISTHLFHHERLRREHLAAVAGAGFEAVELFATRTHVDYHDPAAIADLEAWLDELGLRLHAVHAPVARGRADDRWIDPLSVLAADAAERTEALAEVEAAVELCRHHGPASLVVHLGHAGAPGVGADRSRARQSLEAILAMARPVGVPVAVEVIPNECSTPASLVRLIEDELEQPGIGVCLDFGHAFLQGDVVDAIETLSGHVLTTHVHDNHGREDEHLVPFEGNIDWAAAMMAVRKVGYDGTLLMELAATAPAAVVLERAQRARRHMERLLAD